MKDHSASADHPSGRWWLWAILLVIGLVVVIAPFPTRAADPVEHTFRIDARQFEYAPAVLKVNQGDRVTIELVARDVVHGLSIDGYGIETTADPGATSRISFVAERSGSFRFRCTATCGSLHPFMVGKLEVGQNSLLWRTVLLSGLVALAGVWKARP